ncbi:hypothetical protein ACOSP7_021697 [Xanthoceras sorbifolium]
MEPNHALLTDEYRDQQYESSPESNKTADSTMTYMDYEPEIPLPTTKEGAIVYSTRILSLEKKSTGKRLEIYFNENPDMWKWLTGQEQPPEAVKNNPLTDEYRDQQYESSPESNKTADSTMTHMDYEPEIPFPTTKEGAIVYSTRILSLEKKSTGKRLLTDEYRDQQYESSPESNKTADSTMTYMDYEPEILFPTTKERAIVYSTRILSPEKKSTGKRLLTDEYRDQQYESSPESNKTADSTMTYMDYEPEIPFPTTKEGAIVYSTRILSLEKKSTGKRLLTDEYRDQQYESSPESNKTADSTMTYMDYEPEIPFPTTKEGAIVYSTRILSLEKKSTGKRLIYWEKNQFVGIYFVGICFYVLVLWEFVGSIVNRRIPRLTIRIQPKKSNKTADSTMTYMDYEPEIPLPTTKEGAIVYSTRILSLEKKSTVKSLEKPDMWKWLTGQEQPPEAVKNNPVRDNLIDL